MFHQRPVRLTALFHAAPSRAVAFGAFLGWIVYEMAVATDRTRFGLAMAVVVVACSSAAFVLCTLHVRFIGRRTTVAFLVNQGRTTLTWLGMGFAASAGCLNLMPA